MGKEMLEQEEPQGVGYYDPEKNYNTEYCKEAMRRTIESYARLMPKDNDYKSIIDDFVTYEAIKPDMIGSFNSELEVLQKIVRDCDAFCAKIRQMRDKYGQMTAEKLEKSGSKDEKENLKILNNQHIFRVYLQTIAYLRQLIGGYLFGTLDSEENGIEGCISEELRGMMKGEDMARYAIITHMPIPADISHEMARSSENYLAMAEIARLYPMIISEIMISTENGAAVRLWDRDEEELRPVYTEVLREDYRRENKEKNTDRSMWPIILNLALEKSGIAKKCQSLGALAEAIAGPALKYKPIFIADNENGVLDDEDLYWYLDRNIRNGFPLSARLKAKDGSLKEYFVCGICPAQGSPAGDVQSANVRLFTAGRSSLSDDARAGDCFDLAFGEFKDSLDALGINRSQNMFDYPQIKREQYDIISDEDLTEFRNNMIDEKVIASYSRCWFDVHASLVLSEVQLNEEPDEYYKMRNAVAQICGAAGAGIGNDLSYYESMIEEIRLSEDEYSALLSPDTGKSEKRRFMTCRTISLLCKMYDSEGTKKTDPYGEIVRMFTTRLAARTSGIGPDGNSNVLINYMAEDMLSDEKYMKLIENESVVVLTNPTEKYLDQKQAAYSALQNQED